MTEQPPSKDQVSLDDLKRAIEKVERYKRAPLNEALHNAVGWCAAERDAWRTAFEWRNQERFDMVTPLQTPNMVEYAEGIALIQEKLR